MINDLHLKFLKYGAIFGLVPYITPNGERKHYRGSYLHHYYNCIQQLHQQSSSPTPTDAVLHFNSNGLLRWQKIYTVTLIVANLIATLCGVIFMPFGDNFIVSNLVSIIVFIVQIIALISILLETMFSYNKYYELINNYNKVQILMKQLLQIQLCSSAVRQRQCRKYSFLIVTIHGSLILSIIIIGIKTYCGYFWYALIAIVILRTRSVQMSFYLDYIVYYLELFNVKIKALISCKIDRNYQILDIDYIHLESFEYLQNLKIIYLEIYSLHDKFNMLYGHSLASMFTVVVLDIIINMYWTFLTIFEYYESYYNYITLVTLIPLFVILFMLCYTGEQCEKQCNLILTSFKNLLQSRMYSSKSAASYNLLLESFILQILKNPIRISANGYFTVNLKSLMRILANIATYLIILLQFRKANVSEEMSNQKMDKNITNLYLAANNSKEIFA
ncbi:gustatory receptor 39b [Cochliomyia hominivorax]